MDKLIANEWVFRLKTMMMICVCLHWWERTAFPIKISLICRKEHDDDTIIKIKSEFAGSATFHCHSFLHIIILLFVVC